MSQTLNFGSDEYSVPVQLWCVEWENNLVPAEDYNAARRYCLELRKKGIRGAVVVQKDVGDA